MARQPQDKNMAMLAQKAVEDQDYQIVYHALGANKEPKNLPRNHPAHYLTPPILALLVPPVPSRPFLPPSLTFTIHPFYSAPYIDIHG